MNEYQKTVEYKETLIIYVENIKKKIVQRPIYEAINAPFFEEMDLSPQDSLDLCKNNPNKPQFLQSEVMMVF